MYPTEGVPESAQGDLFLTGPVFSNGVYFLLVSHRLNSKFHFTCIENLEY